MRNPAATKSTAGQADAWSEVLKLLKAQGFLIEGSNLSLPADYDKSFLRDLHREAVKHKIDLARPALERYEDSLLSRLATLEDVSNCEFEPVVVPVTSGSSDERLFRYASLHWSIPVSSGYGRRGRFLVLDSSTQKLMGVIGLCDPVISLSARDGWIGWSSAMKNQNLRYVMDAFVLGAVPPFNHFLGGKLIASLVASNDILDYIRNKYGGRSSRIVGSTHSGEIALITTASALGRSSIYNRLKLRGMPLFESIGFTKGFGEFQFLNGAYDLMAACVKEHATPTWRHESWGTGFRNRREVVRKFLNLVGVSPGYLKHSVRRELFGIKTATNSLEYLRGETNELLLVPRTTAEISNEWRSRWLEDRKQEKLETLDWSPESWRLW